MTAKPARRKPTVPIDKAQLTPAMRGLPNDMWRAAAVARFLVKPGYGANTEAARMAGFGANGKRGNLRITAHGIFHDPRMLEAFHELGEQYLKQGVPDAIAVVQEIMADTKHKDRLAAAKLFIDRAHPVQTMHTVKVEHSPERLMEATAEVLERIRQLAIRAGVDPDEQVELARPKTIEGTATEVKTDEQRLAD
jgi:hypothetical protein